MLMVIGVIGIGLAITALSTLNYVSLHKTERWTIWWIHIARAMIGLLWSGLYLIILIAAPGEEILDWMRMNLVRPIALITLAVMLAAVIARRKRGNL